KLEVLNVRAHLGCEYLTRGTVREGLRILMETLEEAKKAGYRRSVAYTYSMLAIGHYNRGDHARVKKFTRESDAVASMGDVRYVEVDGSGRFVQAHIVPSREGRGAAKVWEPVGAAGSSGLVLNPNGDLRGDGTPDLVVNPRTRLPRAVWAARRGSNYDIVTSE